MRCDNCEKWLVVPRSAAALDEAVAAGWFVVEGGAPENCDTCDGDGCDECEPAEAVLCSRRCLAVWAVVNAKHEIGLA